MIAVWQSARAALHQWGYPKALRIAAPARPGEPGSLLRELEAFAAARAAGAAAAAAAAAPAPPPAAAPGDEAFLIRLGTLSWRLGILAGKVSAGPSTGSLRNRIEALAGLLAQQGLEVIDYSGQDFDPGELWDEVIGEDLPEDAQPYIASMQLPRLRLAGRVLQRGVPIVKDRRQTTDPGAASS